MPRKATKTASPKPAPKAKMGRPSAYKPEYADKLIEYFSDESGKFPTIARFCANHGIRRSVFYHWTTAKDANGNLLHPDFAEAHEMARDRQEALLIEGGISGNYNTAFAIFTAKNLIGWRDKQEVTGADGGPIKTEDVSMLEVARRTLYLLRAGIEEKSNAG